MCKSQKSAGLLSWGRGAMLGLTLLAGWGMGEGRLAAQPANDNLASPQLISGSGGSVGGSTIAATREVGEPVIFGIPGGASVWFRWVAPIGGLIRFDSIGSTFDVTMAAYRNNLGAGVPPTFADLTKLAEDDDSAGGLQSLIGFNAVAGEEYYITIDGFFGSRGSYVLNWSTLTPGNNDCSSAQVISGLSGTVTGRNTGATEQPGEPDHAGNAGGASVWYEWIAPSDGVVEFRTEGSSFNTLLAVYTGDCTTFTSVAADNDGGPNFSSLVRFSATTGTAYRIAVDGFNRATGAIVLSWAYSAAGGQFRFASHLVSGNTAFYTVRESQSNYELWLDGTASPQRGDSEVPDQRVNPLGAEVTVTRVNGYTGRMLVDYRLAGGTAVPFTDFDPTTTTGTLVFDDYQMSAKFVVTLVDDFVLQYPNIRGTIILELFNPRPDVASGEDPTLTGSIGLQSFVQITIEDDEFASGIIGRFKRTNFRGIEGRAARILISKVGASNFLLETRTGNTFALQPGSDYATPGSDFDGNFSLVYPDNAGIYIRDIPIPEETLVEFNEDFLIVLRAGNTIYDTATVTILGEHPAIPAGTPVAEEQPAGAVDRDHNMDSSLLTTPPDNQLPGANGMVFAVAAQTDNKSVIGGDFTAVNAATRNRVARLNRDGSLDTGFNPGTGANGFVAAVALQPNDRAVIGGGFTSINGTGRNRIARLQLDGALDTTFNPGTGVNAPVRAIAVNTNLNTPDFGKIVIGGEFTTVNSTNRSYIARLNSNGQMDPSFNAGAGPNAPVLAVAIQGDGKVVIGGEFTAVGGVPRNRVARLNSDGSLDLSFNPGGGADNTVFAVAIDNSPSPLSATRSSAGNEAEDRFVFDAGTTSGTLRITYDFISVTNTLRVYYEGVPLFDTGPQTNAATVNIPFGPGNTTQIEIVVNEGSLGVPGTVWNYTATVFPSVGVQKVVIGGAFNTVDFRSRNGVARFNADGSLDTTFDPGTGADNTVLAIAMQPDSRAILGGTFTSYNLTRRVGIARLLTNGSLDTSFMDTAHNQFAGLINPISWDPPNFVRSISVQPDGHVMIGGSFKQVGGGYARDDVRPRSNVARLIGGATRGPGNIELMLQNYTVAEDEGNLFISVTRTNGSLGQIGATLASGDRSAGPGSGTADQDYAPLVANPLWPSTYNLRGFSQTRMISDALEGPNFATFVSTPTISFGVTTNVDDVNISVLDDSLQEGDELLNLVLVRPIGTEQLFLGGEHIPLGAALGRSQATLTVVDNDFQHGILGFAITNFVVDENVGVATVTMVRTNGANGTVTVDYTTVDGTGPNAAVGGLSPGPGVHYLIRSGRLTFASGQTEAVISVPIVENTVAEPDRMFGITTTNVTGGAKLNNSILSTTTAVTIIDNDFAPGSLNFAQPVFTVMENGLFATVTVTRTGGNVGAASVVASTVPGGTAAPVDYTDTSVTLTWNDGDSSARSFTVPLNDNRLVDANRTINLALSSPLGAQIGAIQPTAQIQIVNDDSFGQLGFSTANYTINENGGQVAVTVLRTGGNSGAITVDATVSDGTAVGGLDYINPGLVTLSFADGQSSTNFNVPLPVPDDTVQNGNRTFTVTLSNPQPPGGPAAGPVLGGPASATVTIVDNESFNLPAGSVDPTFDPGAGADNFIYSAVVQPDQRLLVAGDFTVMNGVTRTRIARVLDNGLLDPSFDPGRGANAAIRTMAVHTDTLHAGRIVLGGAFTTVQGTNRSFIARLNIDGSLDKDFDPGAGPDNAVLAAAIQPDGRVVIGGAFASVDSQLRNGIARLQTNGVLDATFNPGAGANGSVFAVALQTDGKVLIGGNFTLFNSTARNYLARLNADGSLDPTFDPGTGANGPVRAILVQPDGRIMLGGSFTSVNGVQRHYLARLETSGAVDLGFNTGFDPGSEGGLGSFGANDSVLTLALEPGGKILVGGNFTTFGGVTRNRLTRLNSDGAVDSTINFGTGANNFVASVALQADGKIVAAGGFTVFNGFDRKYLVRLHGGTTAGIGTVEFTASSFTTSENTGFATVTVRRRGSAEGASQVTVEAIDGAATNGVHYIFADTPLTFPPGETLQSFTVQIVDDTQNTPPSRNLTLRLKNFVNATPGLQPTTVLTILNDDGQVGFSSAAYSVNENVVGGTAIITVVRTGTSAGAASVAFLSTTNGTAVPGANFTPVSGTLSFADGEVSKTFSVPIINNSLVQGNRTVELILTNFIGQITPGITRTVLTIIDKDRAAGELNFSQANYFIDEGSAFPGTVGLAIVTVTRTNGSTGAISVNYLTANGTATGGVIAPPGSGVDYINTSGTLSFADGETNKSFSIPVILDGLSEPDETVNLILGTPTGQATLGAQSTARLTIINNDVLLYGNVRFASTNFAALEGDGLAIITVNRVGGSSNQVSVTAMTADFTGVHGTHYVGVTNTVDLVWTNGETGPKTFSVSLIDNAFVDGNKLVSLMLTNVTGGASIGTPGAATLSIQDDDSGPGVLGFTLAGYSILENGTNAVLSVTRTNGFTGTVTVTVATSNNTAVAGVDYTNLVQVLTFLDGETNQTVLVGITDNTTQEGNRSLNLTLSGPTGGALLGLAATSLTIIDDELPAGTTDPGFIPGLGANDTIYALQMHPVDRTVVLGGDFTLFDSVPRTNVARLNADGTLDTSLNAGIITQSSTNASVRALAVHTSGANSNKVVIGGLFDRVGGSNRVNVARLNVDGSVDPGFDPGSGANNAVLAVALQSNGRVLIGGQFTTVNGTNRNFIARLNQDGSLDDTFDPGPGPNGPVRAILIDDNGQILIGGDFTSAEGITRNRIARLYPDGRVDKNFDPGTGANGSVRALALYPDGRLLAGGLFTTLDGVARNRVARLAANGALDVSFDPGTGPDDLVGALALQTDGKILIGGSFVRIGATLSSRLGRLHADGTIDLTFNIGTGANNAVNALVFQDDPVPAHSRIIVAGSFTNFNNTLANRIVRLNGGLNLGAGQFSFGAPAFSVNESGGAAVITVIRTSGLTGTNTVVFSTQDDTATAGFDYTNVLSTLTFLPGQNLTNVSVPVVNNTLIDGDRTLTLALSNPLGGATLGSQPTAVLTIVNDDGVVGFSTAAFSVNENAGNATITVLRAGGTTAAVSLDYTTADGTAQASFDYFTTAGTLNFAAGQTSASFTIPVINDTLVEGSETVLLTLFNPVPTSSVILGPGSATLTIVDDEFQPGVLLFASTNYVVNESEPVASITVLRTNGTSGTVSIDYSTSDGTALAGLDYLGVSGTLSFADGEASKAFLVPILDDLTVDTNELETVNLILSNPTGGATLAGAAGFGVLDVTFNSSQGPDGDVNALVLQADGRLLIGGTFTSVDGVTLGRVARLNVNGALDATFDPGAGANGAVQAVAVYTSGANAGRVVIGGNFTAYDTNTINRILRVNADGSRDTNFNVGTGANAIVRALAISPASSGTNAGKVIIAGDFTTVAGTARNRLARLNADGTLDTTFNNGTGFNGTINAVAIESDGSVLVGGTFTTFTNGPAIRVARLSPDGLLDTSFNTNVNLGPNAAVNALVIQPNGEILIGGAFGTVNGISRNRLARLAIDGTVDLTFDPGAGPNLGVNALAIQSDGRILIGGAFTAVGVVSRNGLDRLNADGSRDVSFDPGAGANGPVNAIVVQPDTRIVIGGAFDMFNGNPKPRVARLEAGAAIGLALATLTIVDNDIAIGFSTNDFQVAESGLVQTISVTRSGLSNLTFVVDFTTLDGTAFGGLDYVPTNGSLTFGPNETNKTFEVAILNDLAVEGNELLNLRLTGTGGANLTGLTNAIMTILDDDTGYDLAVGVTSVDSVYSLREPVYVGSNFAYQVSVTNFGPSWVTGVTLTNALPLTVQFNSQTNSLGLGHVLSGNILTFDLGTLTNGSVATFMIFATATNPASGFVTNLAAILPVALGAATDANPNNNVATNALFIRDPSPFIDIATNRSLTSVTNESQLPANGAIDPGETVTLNLALQNRGNQNTAGSIVATLLATNGVTSPSGAMNYGSLAVNQVAVRPFTFTASGTNGQTIVLTLQLTDNGVFLSNNVVLVPFTLGASTNFANTSAVVIPDTGAALQPGYPSTITVSNLGGMVGKVTVTLSNLTHSFPADLDLLLVSPTGEKVMIMSDAGVGPGNNGITNVTLTLDQDAAVDLPREVKLTNGTYRPYDHTDSNPDSFPSPAPTPPYATNLMAFNGINPNGIWSLYVVDDSAGDPGAISNGWSLNITAINPVSPTAGLSLTVTNATNSVLVGDTIVYTLLVTNHGPETATGVAITNTLPAGVSFVAATNSVGGSFMPVGNTVVFSIGTLLSNQVSTNYLVVIPRIAGTIINQATVSASQTDPYPPNNSASLSTTVAPSANLLVSLTVAGSSAFGANLTNLITVQNLGPSPATSIVLTSTFPASASFVAGSSSQGAVSAPVGNLVTASLGTLASNASATVTIVSHPNSIGSVTNTAAVGSPVFDVNTTNNSASAVSTVNASADLVVAIASVPNPVVVTSNLTYTIAVTNLGLSAATNVVVTDTLPGSLTFVAVASSQGTSANVGGTITCNLGNLAVGAAATVTIQVRPNVVGPVNNTAFVSAATADPNTANNSATVVTTVNNRSVEIVVAGVNLVSESNGVVNGAVDPGETVTIAFGLRNKGGTDTTNLVATLLGTGGVITNSPQAQSYGLLVAGGDSRAANFTFTASGSYGDTILASLELRETGGGANLSLGTVTFPLSLGTINTFSNTTQILILDNTQAAPYPSAINVSNITGTIIKVVVSLNNLSHTYPDDIDVLLESPNGQSMILMSDAGGGQGVGGLNLTFDDAAAVSLPDNPPSAAMTNGTYKPSNFLNTSGNPATTNDTFVAPAPQPAAGTLHPTNLSVFSGANPNGAWKLYVVDDSSGDFGIINDGWSLRIISVATLNPSVDLAVALTNSPTPAHVGSNLTYTAIVTNRGPNTATNVVLTNFLPVNASFVSASSSQGTFTSGGSVVTFSIGTLLSGAQATNTIIVNPAALPAVTLTSVVSSAQIELASANNTATRAVEVINLPVDLALTMSGSPNPVSVMGNVTFALVVTNLGPNSAIGVKLTNTLPSSVTFVSATGGGTNSGNLVAFDLGTLTNGASLTNFIVVTANQVGAFTNSALVAIPNQTETNLVNNVATAVITVEGVQFTAAATRVATDGSFQFGLMGRNNMTYVIEVSTNLASWTPIFTNSTLSGALNFIDTNAPNYTSRFYRAVER